MARRGIHNRATTAAAVVALLAPGAAGAADGAAGRIDPYALYVRGGAVMPVLAAAALLGIGLVGHSLWTLRRARVNTRRLIGSVITTLRNDGPDAAAQLCQRSRGPVAAIMNAGLQKLDQGPEAMRTACAAAGVLELAFLERGLIWLRSIASLAPVIGFLGTVARMLRTSDALAAAAHVDARLIASGLSEALIPAAVGLLVAVPLAVAHSGFVAANGRLVYEMEASAGELVEEVVRLHLGGR